MRRVIFFTLVFFSLLFDYSFAIDWKKLHEEADRRSLPDSLLAVGQKVDSVNDLYVLALVYLNLHKDREAEATFSKIIKLKPDTFEARWGLAECLFRQHELAKSEVILREVIKADPDFSPVYISMAFLRYIQLDFKSTVKFALKVIEQGRDKVDLSNYVRAYTLYAGGKGMIAHYGGPFSKIINGTAILPNLKKADKMQPDSAAVAFGLGAFYLLAPPLVGGNLNKAEEYLKKAILLDPLFVNPYVRLAQVYKIKGDTVKYEFYIKKAIEIDPKNEFLQDTLSGRCKFVCTQGKDD